MARRDRAGVASLDAPASRTVGVRTLERAAADPDAPMTGPYDDGDDLDLEDVDAGRVDFGAVRVPVPARGTVLVEPSTSGRPQAVHVTLPEGRLSVSALAAPTSSKLWPDLAREIYASLRDGGARVRSFPGPWGRELHATTGSATSVFVGVDGPRWMLYGVATGPTTHAVALDAELRQMLRGTVVVRGRSPYPVRSVLPLVLPAHLTDAAAEPAAPVVVPVPEPEPSTEPFAVFTDAPEDTEPLRVVRAAARSRSHSRAHIAAPPPRRSGRHALPEPEDSGLAGLPTQPLALVGVPVQQRSSGRHRLKE